MKSFIAWIGGKALLAKKIISMFPDNAEVDRYIEVFGGAVLFYLLKIRISLKFITM